MIRIRISDPRSLGSWQIKWTDESTLDKDSSVHLIYHYPSDLGSQILIQIIPKESTLGFWISRGGFRIPGCLFVEPGFLIPILSGIPDSKPRIPDSTIKKFEDSGIQIPLQGATFHLQFSFSYWLVNCQSCNIGMVCQCYNFDSWQVSNWRKSTRS